jgi:hypothetical protein
MTLLNPFQYQVVELEAGWLSCVPSCKLSHIFSYGIIGVGLADNLRTSVGANTLDTRRAIPQSAKRKSIHPAMSVSVCKLIYLNKFPFPKKQIQRAHKPC